MLALQHVYVFAIHMTYKKKTYEGGMRMRVARVRMRAQCHAAILGSIDVSFAASRAMQQVFAELAKDQVELNFGVYNKLQRNQAVDAAGLLNGSIKAFVAKWIKHVDAELKVDVSKLRNCLQMVLGREIKNPTGLADDGYIKFLLRQIVVFCLHVRRLKQQEGIKSSAMKKVSEEQRAELEEMLGEIGVGVPDPVEIEGEMGEHVAVLTKQLTQIFAAAEAAQDDAEEEDEEEDEEEAEEEDEEEEDPVIVKRPAALRHRKEDEEEEDPRERRLQAQRKSTGIPEGKDGLKKAVIVKRPAALRQSTSAPKPGKKPAGARPPVEDVVSLKVRVGGDSQKSYVQVYDHFVQKWTSYGNCTMKASQHHRPMMEELADWISGAQKPPTREVCSRKVEEYKAVYAARAATKAELEKSKDAKTRRRCSQKSLEPSKRSRRPAAAVAEDEDEMAEDEDEMAGGAEDRHRETKEDEEEEDEEDLEEEDEEDEEEEEEEEEEEVVAEPEAAVLRRPAGAARLAARELLASVADEESDAAFIHAAPPCNTLSRALLRRPSAPRASDSGKGIVRNPFVSEDHDDEID